MPYYSTYYRKLLGMDSPSGRSLVFRRVRVQKPKVPKSRRIPQPKIIHRKKPKAEKIEPLVKKYKLRKPKTGLSLVSKTRRGQLRMRPSDIYEGQMVKRLRKQTGMTHVQVMNLVNLGKRSDYIDVETEIASVSGLSKQKEELYEFGKKRISKLLERETPASERYELMGAKELDWEWDKWTALGEQWYRKQKKMSLI